jgi:hypothetical protein
MPGLRRRASRTTRGPSPYFIPGTNSIKSLNYQLRKVTKNRGYFPNDEAAVKLLWLAICNIEDKRARERLKERHTPAGVADASTFAPHRGPVTPDHGPDLRVAEACGVHQTDGLAFLSTHTVVA